MWQSNVFLLSMFFGNILIFFLKVNFSFSFYFKILFLLFILKVAC